MEGFLSVFGAAETPAKPMPTVLKKNDPIAVELSSEFKSDEGVDEEIGGEDVSLVDGGFAADDDAITDDEPEEQTIALGFVAPDAEDDDSKFPIEKTKIYLFIMADFQWTVLVLFSHLFFWKYGLFDAFSMYGYKDYIADGDAYAEGYRIYSSQGQGLLYFDTCELGTGCLNTNGHGRIVSGPSGSGVFVISLLLMVMGSLVWVSRFFAYDAQKEHPEIEVMPLEAFFSWQYAFNRYL